MSDELELVLAMPRRELYRVSGCTRPPDMQALAALADDNFFAAPSHLAGNLDSKEVRVGVTIERTQQRVIETLIDDSGSIVHISRVPPESTRLGDGLLMLRQVAALAGCGLLGLAKAPIELIGLLNDDVLPECRGFVLLLYRLKAPEDTAAPAGMTWVARDRLATLPLHPVSALLVEPAKA